MQITSRPLVYLDLTQSFWVIKVIYIFFKLVFTSYDCVD